MMTLHRSLVRPNSNTAEPFSEKYAILLENVQRRATKLITGLKQIL